jgi:hypothetical protein
MRTFDLRTLTRVVIKALRRAIAGLPTNAVLRAQAIGEKQGFMKMLVSAQDDRILGFGSEAGEVMAVMQTAMLACTPIRLSATPFLRTRPWPRDWASSSPTCQPARCNRPRPKSWRCDDFLLRAGNEESFFR